MGAMHDRHRESPATRIECMTWDKQRTLQTCPQSTRAHLSQSVGESYKSHTAQRAHTGPITSRKTNALVTMTSKVSVLSGCLLHTLINHDKPCTRSLCLPACLSACLPVWLAARATCNLQRHAQPIEDTTYISIPMYWPSTYLPTYVGVKHIMNTMVASRLVWSPRLRLQLRSSNHIRCDSVLPISHDSRRGKVILEASGPQHVSVFLQDGARHTPIDAAAVAAAIGCCDAVISPQFGSIDKKNDEGDNAADYRDRQEHRYFRARSVLGVDALVVEVGLVGVQDMDPVVGVDMLQYRREQAAGEHDGAEDQDASPERQQLHLCQRPRLRIHTP
mmetsp:Transcript_8792/g.25246  ORF Transcript_8792/g.25246 Transcript_8792/m.25246 type:complete len:333 (+) Transcript_8792:659-1657(+)